MRSTWVLVAVCIGCGGKEEPPAASGSQTKPEPPADAKKADKPAGDAAAAAGSAAAPATPAAACLPDVPANLGRVGTDIVGCTGDDATCWTIDKTGKVTPHAPVHLPGVGFVVERTTLKKPSCYQDLCWSPPKHDADTTEDSRIWVAYHPDGKRAAIIDDPAGTIFDLATKKPIATFKTDLGNSLGGLWFAGNFVVDAGFDAGPYAVLVYHDAKTGKKVGTFEDFFGGGATVSSAGALLVVGQDMTTVSVIEGKSHTGKTTTRKIPKAPAGCAPQDPGLDTESDDPKVKACAAFVKKHYAPFGGNVIDDPAGGYVGITNGELFTVDAKLVETSRVKLPMCPKKDEE